VRHNIRLLLILFTLRGPSRVSTMGGARYYVIFVDDFLRFTWIYLLHSRSDFLQVYRDFYTMIRTQFSKNIPILRSNSGGEYKSRPFKELLVSQGTLPQLSCTDTPQQNDGVAERKHRHIMETTRALLLSSSVPKKFWGEAALTSVYVINRIPSSVIAGLSPFERLYGSTPYSSELLVFGSTCFVLLAKVERDKLSKKKICYLCVCFWVMALNKRDIDAMTQKHRSFESLGMSPSGKRFLFILSLVFVHLLFQILSPSCSLILF